MIVSLNEIETTVLKAARGAGMEWGLAEEAAQAAGWLARYALPWEAPLLALLGSAVWRTPPRLDGNHLRPRSADAWLCPVRAGAYLSDLGEGAPTVIERVLHPLLLLPFAARRDTALDLEWSRVTVRLDAGTVVIEPTNAAGLDATRADRVTLTRSTLARPRQVSPPRRLGVAVEEMAWARLQDFVARTYVPASVKSRLGGAGPATDDND